MLFNIIFIRLQSQNFEWAKREGNSAYDYGYGITTDSIGNIYVAGKYEMNANFSDTIIPNYGYHDIFLAKYSAGGVLIWIRTAGGIYGDYAESIYCDGSHIYITGEIEGYGTAVTFQNSPITLTCKGDNDMFLAKYDLNGNLLWAKKGGGNYNDKGLAVTADINGNIYVTGFFTDTASFSGTTIYGNGNRDIFIAKYDSIGNFQWVRQAGSSQRDEAKSIICDHSGNIYVTGMYSDGAAFGSAILTSPLGYFNIFLAKYAPDGSLIWIKTAGGDYDDVAWSITKDNAGKIYITGEFNAYAHFDNIALTTTGKANIFVACYDESGNAQWAKSAGGPLIDRARGIGSDGTNLYITGQFGMSANFGSYSVTGVDSSEIFMAKISNTGNFEWAAAVSGPPDLPENLGYESGNAICADSFGNVYATGALLNGGVFGSSSFLPYSRTDAFIAKLSSSINVKMDEYLKGNISIYPNPNNGNFTVHLNSLGAEKIEITITNCLGQVIYNRLHESSSQNNIDLSAQQNGIYFIEIITEDQTIYRAKILRQ